MIIYTELYSSGKVLVVVSGGSVHVIIVCLRVQLSIVCVCVGGCGCVYVQSMSLTWVRCQEAEFRSLTAVGKKLFRYLVVLVRRLL